MMIPSAGAAWKNARRFIGAHEISRRGRLGDAIRARVQLRFSSAGVLFSSFFFILYIFFFLEIDRGGLSFFFFDIFFFLFFRSSSESEQRV